MTAASDPDASWSGRAILLTNPGAELYGADRVVLETISALTGSGASVIVTLPQDGPLSDHIRERGGRLVTVPTAILRKSALHPIGFLRLIKDAVTGIAPAVRLIRRERPSVIIVNTIVSPLWLLAAKLTGTPVISHVHEAETAGSRFIRKALTFPQLMADRLIVNSEFSRDVMVRSWRRLATRSVVVYNAVPGPPTVTPPRVQLSPPVRLLYVGRLSPRKGPDVAVDAVRLLVERGVDVQLDLVGAVFTGYEWFEKQLHKQVEDLGLIDRVHFHGFSDDIWPFAAQADISLVPSTADEPFGNTAVEAALAGRPLIVSATSGLLEACRGLNASIGVPPRSPLAIADAVQTMIERWEEYADLAARDAATTADRYSVARYAAELVEVVNAASGLAETSQSADAKAAQRQRPI